MGCNDKNLEGDVEELEPFGGGIKARVSGWGTRHTVAVFAFLGYFSICLMRIDLSMAIVGMVKSYSDSNRPSSNGSCGHLAEPALATDLIIPKSQGEFDWSPEEQGVILSSFFWGYVLTQFPFGILTNRFGARWIFFMGVAFAATAHLLIPTAARMGKNYLIACRILQGFGEGAVPASTQYIMAQWSVPSERSRIGALIFSGIQAASVVTLLFSGLIIDSPLGWPGVFYTFGGIAMIWCISWLFVGYNRPSEHPWISKDELDFIQNAMGDEISEEKIKTPWRDILTSLPVYAVIIAQISDGWAFLGAALCLIGVSFSGCDRTLTIILVTLAIAINGNSCVGHLVNFMDISPNYSSTLMGLASALTNLCGVITPYLTGVIIQSDEADIDNWRWVFLISAGIYLFGFGFFMIFASGKTQDWNQPKIKSEESRDESSSMNDDNRNRIEIQVLIRSKLDGKITNLDNAIYKSTTAKF